MCLYIRSFNIWQLAGARPALPTDVSDQNDTQPVDIMNQEVRPSPIRTNSPEVPTAALRKNYQGVSPPALPTPVATEPLAAKAPQVPETKTPTCDGSGDAGLTEGKVG